MQYKKSLVSMLKHSSLGALSLSYTCFNARIHTYTWCQLLCDHCAYTQFIFTRLSADGFYLSRLPDDTHRNKYRWMSGPRH